MAANDAPVQLRLEFEPLDIPYHEPFRIAGHTYSGCSVLLCRMHAGALSGMGESAPSVRLRETAQSLVHYFMDHPVRAETLGALKDALREIPPTARCGVDTARYDLIGKQEDVPVYELLGLDPSATPVTSITLGIASIEHTLEVVAQLRDQPVLKFKVGSGGERELLDAVRSIYTGTVRIDANEGWSVEGSVAMLRGLERYGIEFCEQPIPAGKPEQLRYIRERTPIPIVADEDVAVIADLDALRDCVDGVCLSLSKCGGIDGTLEMIEAARERNFKIMLGSRVESVLLNTAAAHISPLADWADLDAAYQNPLDPFSGITYDRGKIVLPSGHGLGVTLRAGRKPQSSYAR